MKRRVILQMAFLAVYIVSNNRVIVNYTRSHVEMVSRRSTIETASRYSRL